MDVVVELLQEGKFKKYNAEYHRALSYASTLSVPNNAFAGMKYFVGSIKSYKKANWFKRTFILDPYRVFKYFLFYVLTFAYNDTAVFALLPVNGVPS